MHNRVTLIGKVGERPSREVTKRGSSLLKMNLLVESQFMDADGGALTRRESFKIVAFGATAKHCNKLNPGDLVHIEGNLQIFRWNDHEAVHEELMVRAIRVLSLSPAKEFSQHLFTDKEAIESLTQ